MYVLHRLLLFFRITHLNLKTNVEMATGRLTMRVNKMMRTRRYTYVQQQTSRLAETQIHQLKCSKHTRHVKIDGCSSTDMDTFNVKQIFFFQRLP